MVGSVEYSMTIEIHMRKMIDMREREERDDDNDTY